MKNIILLAPPASGKGTQASLLEEKFNLIHVSTGDLLRDAAKRSNELGRRLNEIMSSGILVSDEIVSSLLKNKIEENKMCNGFIFDGFPRTISQAKQLNSLLYSLNMKIDYVFLLEVDYETLLKRITGRRTCKTCGRIYNIHGDCIKPEVDNICNYCGDTLSKRSDDNEDSFKTRYQEYLDKTYPLVDYYETEGNLIRIDSLKSVDEVFNRISSIIERDV